MKSKPLRAIRIDRGRIYVGANAFDAIKAAGPFFDPDHFRELPPDEHVAVNTYPTANIVQETVGDMIARMGGQPGMIEGRDGDLYHPGW